MFSAHVLDPTFSRMASDEESDEYDDDYSFEWASICEVEGEEKHGDSFPEVKVNIPPSTSQSQQEQVVAEDECNPRQSSQVSDADNADVNEVTESQSIASVQREHVFAEAQPSISTSHASELSSPSPRRQQSPQEECKDDPKTPNAKPLLTVNTTPVFSWRSRQLQKVHRPMPASVSCATQKVKVASKDGAAAKDKPESSAKKTFYSKQRLNELARPNKHHLYEKGTLNINVTSSKNVIGTTTGKTKNTNHRLNKEEEQSFLDRMEILQRQRQEKLERAAAKSIYDANTDKKLCKNCGTIQSYEEMIQGRLNCTNDRCVKLKSTYQLPKKFRLKQFEDRMKRSEQRRNFVLEQIEAERSISCVKKSRRQRELIDKVSRGGNNFQTRMEKDIAEREMKLNHIGETDVKKTYTFQPKLYVSEHLIRNRKGGLDSLTQPQKRYTEGYIAPEPGRRKKSKKKKGRKPLVSPWQQSALSVKGSRQRQRV